MIPQKTISGRIKENRPDYPLLFSAVFLVGLGILILASASANFSQEKLNYPSLILRRQILFGVIPGAILGFLAFKTPIDYFKKTAPILLLIIVFLTALVFVPQVGISSGGATRWINLGFISFQPSEFLKLAFIFYLAACLPNWTEKKKKASFKKIEKFSISQGSLLNINTTFIAFLFILGAISLLLILQPDISTLMVIFLSAILMYFLAETPLSHTVIVISMAAGGLLALIKVAPYRFNRLLVFLNSEIDPMGLSYQSKQAIITIGSGGITGLGLGMSAQKFGFLPQPMTDSIFAIFAEETGLIGGLVLISLFLIFAWRVFKISKKTADKFCRLTALGIGFWIIIQAFINIGSMAGILPLTGIPLPFVSYGGSAMVAELIGLGVLLNISKQTV